MREIVNRFPKIVAEGGQRNTADPFVIAYAKQHGLTVVTGEREHGGSEKKPNIPFLCKKFDLRCINMLGLIRSEKWLF